MEKAQALQERLYFILEKLQELSKQLPSAYQQRISMDLLSGLANTLLHDTVFAIVQGLKEIQDVTEKQLFQQRLKLLDKQRVERQILREKQATSPSTNIVDKKETEELIYGQKEELKQNDIMIVQQMDQKVSDQQMMMQKAGVPGFYITNSPSEIKIQMYLFEFILKLSKMQLPYVKLDDEEMDTI